MYQEERFRDSKVENIQLDLPKDLDLICFGQTTSGSEAQRPFGLMSRFAADRRVFFIEEPIFEDQVTSPYYHTNVRYMNKSNVIVVVPHLAKQDPKPNLTMIELVNQFIQEFKIERYILWYCTPMALRYSFQLSPELVVYDSIPKHSATTETKLWESELLVWSDVVFSIDRNRNSGSDDTWNYVNQRIMTAFQQKKPRILPRTFNQIEWHEVQLTGLEL